MDFTDQLAHAGALAGALLALAGVLTLARRGVGFVTRTLRMLREFLEDWNGEQPRPGVPGRLGVMARLQRIEDRLPTDPPPVTVNLNVDQGGTHEHRTYP